MSFAYAKFYVYIVTNPNKTTLYIGVTNNLCSRICEHWESRGQFEKFAGRYFCYNLIYYEMFDNIQDAINRESEIKKWNREKKEVLIQRKNPEWLFLNKDVCKCWPPTNRVSRF